MTIVNVTAQSTAGTQTVIENGLVGIKLLDPGLKVLNMYGTPNEIYGIGAGVAPSALSAVEASALRALPEVGEPVGAEARAQPQVPR